MPKTRNVKKDKTTSRDNSLQSKVLHPYPPVTIQPRRKMISRTVAAAQFKLTEEAGPYYMQAWRIGERKAFLNRFYSVWFTLWPEIPTDKDDLEAVAHRRQITRRFGVILPPYTGKSFATRQFVDMKKKSMEAKHQEKVNERQIQAQRYLEAQRKKVFRLQEDEDVLKDAQLLAEFAAGCQQRMSLLTPRSKIVRSQEPTIKCAAFRHHSGELGPSPLRSMYIPDTTASGPTSDETDSAAL
ncbi:hypothetical protein JR316_0010228 [Psilocybe cubensis]|uniref:Uncharacterized protein n=1 Tax=Psilocybe cubensis TaxID=181762 RepID=A0ACB8GSN2_PSICU|nr:hypothetical protein JR316_0010228 [Psilocybe cubensis]KAH9477995.1 hypothetical protein JR316_0010228 [Psilocybe cubensis]